jgi:large subunit ribosomal protein L16
MLSFPRKTKFKKQQKGKAFNRINSTSIEPYSLKFGSIGLKALTSGRVTAKQIESVRQSISKIIKKQGHLRINVFPDTPISKKPIEVRMGKGKGAVDHWVFKVKPGFILYEIETAYTSLAIKALESGKIRLPIQSKIVFN